MFSKDFHKISKIPVWAEFIHVERRTDRRKASGLFPRPWEGAWKLQHRKIPKEFTPMHNIITNSFNIDFNIIFVPSSLFFKQSLFSAHLQSTCPAHKNGLTKAPRSYVTCILPVLFIHYFMKFLWHSRRTNSANNYDSIRWKPITITFSLYGKCPQRTFVAHLDRNPHPTPFCGSYNKTN